jgi:hypothetical protein
LLEAQLQLDLESRFTERVGQCKGARKDGHPHLQLPRIVDPFDLQSARHRRVIGQLPQVSRHAGLALGVHQAASHQTLPQIGRPCGGPGMPHHGHPAVLERGQRRVDFGLDVASLEAGPQDAVESRKGQTGQKPENLRIVV